MGTLAIALGFALMTAADDPAPAPDRSLSVERYVDLGVPSPTRSWTAVDIEVAVKALQSIDGGKATLPRRRSPKSGRLFARMVDVDNLGLALNRNLPAPQRMSEVLQHSDNLRPLLTLYYDPATQTQEFGAEFLDVMLYSMRVAEVAMIVAEEFRATLTDKARRDPVRIQGLKQTKDGFATLIVANLTILDEVRQYSTADLRRYARELADRLPAVWPLLDPTTHREFNLRLDRIGKSHPDGEVREAVRALLKAVDRPVEPSKPEAPGAPGGKPS